MRKSFSLLLVLCMLLITCLYAVQAEEWDEQEFSFDALVNPPTPAPAPGSTPLPTATPEPTPEPLYQPDGSIEITLTAVGDVTIGRNVQHKGTSIFEKELKKMFLFDIFQGKMVFEVPLG